jgi:hypothetical protein
VRLLKVLQDAQQADVVRRVDVLEADARRGAQHVSRCDVAVVGQVAQNQDERSTPALVLPPLNHLPAVRSSLQQLGVHGCVCRTARQRVCWPRVADTGVSAEAAGITRG